MASNVMAGIGWRIIITTAKYRGWPGFLLAES